MSRSRVPKRDRPAAPPARRRVDEQATNLVQRALTAHQPEVLDPAAVVYLQFLLAIAAPPAGAELTDLDDLDQLVTRFNEDRDLTRLVLVLAPT